MGATAGRPSASASVPIECGAQHAVGRMAQRDNRQLGSSNMPRAFSSSGPGAFLCACVCVFVDFNVSVCLPTPGIWGCVTSVEICSRNQLNRKSALTVVGRLAGFAGSPRELTRTHTPTQHTHTHIQTHTKINHDHTYCIQCLARAA